VTDNPTSAFVDGSLPTGTYRFEVDACTFSGGPGPTCDTFLGPKNVKIVRIAGNEPERMEP
jgi:hypothetical protein